MTYRFNCWERQAGALLAEHGLDLGDVWPMFWQHPFNGDRTTPTVGTALRSVNLEIQHMIEAVLGVPVREHRIESDQHALQHMRDELRVGRGLVAFANARFCHWSPAYGLYDNNHFVVVRSIDLENGVICVDDHFHDVCGLQMSVADFHLARGSVFCFHFAEREPGDGQSAIARLSSALAQSRLTFGTGQAGLAERLSSALNAFEYAREVRGFEANWWSSPLFSKLIKIENAHNNICVALRSENSDLSAAFARLAGRWETIRSMFLAAANPKMLERSKRTILVVAGKAEVEAADVEAGLREDEREVLSIGTPVAIAHLFDRRWFEGGDPERRPAFDLMLAREDWPAPVWMEGRRMNFDLSAVIGNGFDCMAGNGQKIALPISSESRRVHVLYTRTAASSPASFVLHTTEGVSSHALSGNTVLCIEESPQERVAWAELRQPSGIPTLRMGYIFLRTIDLPMGGDTVEMDLPHDAGVQIFAVTLE